MIISIQNAGLGVNCDVKSCNRKAEYSIFGWDGQPKLSRLDACACGQHLKLVTDRVFRADKKYNVFRKTYGKNLVS